MGPGKSREEKALGIVLRWYFKKLLVAPDFPQNAMATKCNANIEVSYDLAYLIAKKCQSHTIGGNLVTPYKGNVQKRRAALNCEITHMRIRLN